MQNEGIDDQTIEDMIDRALIGRDLRVDRLPMHQDLVAKKIWFTNPMLN